MSRQERANVWVCRKKIINSNFFFVFFRSTSLFCLSLIDTGNKRLTLQHQLQLQTKMNRKVFRKTFCQFGNINFYLIYST